MIDREIRDARNKAIEDAVASMENRMRHLFNQGFELGKIAAKKEETRVKKETPTSRWIPCSERVPEENEFYLATIYLREMQTAFCDILFYGAPQLCEDRKIGWYFMHDGDMEQVFNVIAWMPLPKPYRESEE